MAVGAYPALMRTVATIATGNHFLLDAVDAVAVLGVARVAVVGIERWRGLPIHSPDAIARRAQVTLVGVILVVWLGPRRWQPSRSPGSERVREVAVSLRRARRDVM